MKNTLLSIIAVVLLGLGFWWFLSNTDVEDNLIQSPDVSVSPTVSGSISPTATSQPAITITSPAPNSSVDSPVTVTGRARVFENTFMVYLKNNAGNILYQTYVMTDAKDSGVFGNYSVKIPIPAGMGSNFKIEASNLSAKGDGTYEGFAEIPIRLKSTATSTVYAAYTVTDDCTTTTLFPRTIIKTQEVAFLGLVELLEGPTTSEKSKGATTQIPTGVKINSLRIQGDTAYADFDHRLDENVAGSCRVIAIRSQITNTLKQFPSIKNVVISINGRTDDILQP